MKVISRNALRTKKIAAALAKKIVKMPVGKKAKTIALVGDLGAGKTTFVQGFLKSLAVKHRVISPTFLILRPYAIKKNSYNRVYHIDAYRLHFPKELEALGFKNILANPRNIVIAEWADKIKKLLPKETIWINFNHGQEVKTRLIKISPYN